MSLILPNTFATKSGSIQLSLLDDNFTYIATNIDTTNTNLNAVLSGLIPGNTATGGGTDKIFYLNGKTITQNYTVPADNNAFSAGPITIADGVTVTVSDGSTWSII